MKRSIQVSRKRNPPVLVAQAVHSRPESCLKLSSTLKKCFCVLWEKRNVDSSIGGPFRDMTRDTDALLPQISWIEGISLGISALW